MQTKWILTCVWASTLVLKPCTDVPDRKRPSSGEHGEGWRVIQFWFNEREREAWMERGVGSLPVRGLKEVVVSFWFCSLLVRSSTPLIPMQVDSLCSLQGHIHHASYLHASYLYPPWREECSSFFACESPPPFFWSLFFGFSTVYGEFPEWGGPPFLYMVHGHGLVIRWCRRWQMGFR